MAILKRTAFAVLLLLLVSFGIFYLVERGDNISSDAHIVKDIFKEGKEYNDGAFSADFGFAHFESNPGGSEKISLTLYPEKIKPDTLKKVERIVKPHFPDDSDRIMAALTENLDAAKNGAIFSGRPAFQLDKSENSVSIINWKRVGNTEVSLNIKRGEGKQ